MQSPGVGLADDRNTKRPFVVGFFYPFPPAQPFNLYLLYLDS